MLIFGNRCRVGALIIAGVSSVHGHPPFPAGGRGRSSNLGQRTSSPRIRRDLCTQFSEDALRFAIVPPCLRPRFSTIVQRPCKRYASDNQRIARSRVTPATFFNLVSRQQSQSPRQTELAYKTRVRRRLFADTSLFSSTSKSECPLRTRQSVRKTMGRFRPTCK